MKYAKLLSRILEQKNPDTGWVYGTPWYRMFYNEKTKVIYISSRKWISSGQHIFGDEQNAWVRFFPDDTALIPKNQLPNSIMLNAIGIIGKYRSRITPYAETVFVHEFTDKYEVIRNMRFAMTDGRPLNARLLSEINIDLKRKKEVDDILRGMKTVYVAAQKFKGTTAHDYMKLRFSIKEKEPNPKVAILNCVNAYAKNEPYDKWGPKMDIIVTYASWRGTTKEITPWHTIRPICTPTLE